MSRTFRNSISLADSSFLQFSSFRPQSTSSSLFSFQTHLTIMVVSPLKKPSQIPIPTPSEALQRTFQINCSLLQCRKTSLSSQLSLLSQLSPSFIKVFIFQDGKAALPQTRVSYSGSKQYHSSMDRWSCCNNLYWKYWQQFLMKMFAVWWGAGILWDYARRHRWLLLWRLQG